MQTNSSLINVTNYVPLKPNNLKLLLSEHDRKQNFKQTLCYEFS